MDAGPSRKRLRRSTRSCYQCRKRKVKCQLTDENVQTCAECVKTGTQCSLQPTGTDLSCEGSPANGDSQDRDSRLERIEALLSRLLESQRRSQPLEAQPESASEATVPAPIWNDFLLQSAVDGNLPPLLDHDSIRLQPADTPDARVSLLALLPSPQDALIIASNSNASLWGAESPPGSVLTPCDALQLLDTTAISRGTALEIAKTMILFALYMQQLPANFHVQFLESRNVGEAVALIADRVRAFVLSHEEEACSPDGLECLLLLSQIHLNNCALRKAWMTFRTVLDTARLTGLPASFSIASRNSTRADMALRRRLWLSAVCGDCYCSLLLGLEPGLGVMPFGPDDETWNDPSADDDANVQRRICLVVARIAQRNAAGMHHDRGILQELDGTLSRLRHSLAATWWKAPAFRFARPLDSAKEPNRLICQLWYYQAQMFLHLPVAFTGSMAGSLDSLEACMEAARTTLHRYLGLQHARDQLARCRAVEQSALLAAAVLILAVVQLRPQKMRSAASRYDSDHALLEQVIESFEAQGQAGNRENVARRSAELLSNMLNIANSEDDSLAKGSSSSGTATPFEDERSATEDDFSLVKFELGDIIKSSVLPALEVGSPASRLITQLFAMSRLKAAPSGPFAATCHTNEGGLFDDFMNSAM